MNKDYYKTLGLEKNASTEDVKNAFRRLAMEHHPDRGGNAEKFKEANEAYQVLSDKDKRSQYDRFGTVNEGPPGFGGNGGFSGFGGHGFNINLDDLGDMFGGLGDMFGGGRQNQREARGRDIEVDAKIDFRDSVFGTQYALNLNKGVRCSHCQGTGGEPGSKLTECATCHGEGRILRQQRTVFGVIQSASACTDCHGQGKLYDKKCHICHGSGIAHELRQLNVKIPAGIDDGSTLRIANEGEAGERNRPAGDLYVHVRVKADQRFEREGDDIRSELKISFALAALGGEAKVETVDGQLDVKIPSGIQPGNVIRLKGHGVTHLRSAGRGDQLVTVVIEVPRKLNKKQRQLLEEIRRENI